MKKLLASVFALVLSGAAAQAEDPYNVYVCTFNVTHKPFLAPEVIIFDNLNSDEVLVYDGYIHEEGGEPKSAKVLTNDDERITISWRVLYTAKTTRGNSVTTYINYRLSNNKAKKKASVRFNVTGYPNQSVAQGPCTVTRDSF